LKVCGGRGLLWQSRRPRRRDGVRFCPLFAESTVLKLQSERDPQNPGSIFNFMTTYWLYVPLKACLRRCYFLENLSGEMLPVRTDARRLCIVLLTKTGPPCISFRCKITVSLAQGAVRDAEADFADPVFVRSTIASSRPFQH